MAEQGCLLSSYPDKIGIGGSNPPLSAIRHYLFVPCNSLRRLLGSWWLRPLSDLL